MMTLNETYVLASFALFSLADLRYRLIPGVELFFVGALLLGLPAAPVQVVLLLLTCAWGLFRTWPGWLALPLLCFPPAWPVLLAAYGYRKGLLGRADLLSIAGLACLFPLPVVLLCLLGLDLWRRFWSRRRGGAVPALPGLLLGLLAYLLPRLLFPLS